MNDKDNINNSKFPSVILKKTKRDIVVKREVNPNIMDSAKIKDDENDIRVKLAKYFIAIVFIITTTGMFTPSEVVYGVYPLITMFFLLALVMYIGFFALRNDAVGSLIFLLLSLYIWFAFPFKLMVAINDPEVLWISPGIFDAKTIRDEIADSFFIVFPSLVFLLLGLFLLHRNRDIKSNYMITKVSHSSFIVVIVLLMGLRVITQTVYGIGVPGISPTILPIPYLAGFLSLLTKAVLFAVVNLYFYYVLRLNDRKKILVALFFLLINVILGLRVGYKSELVLQALLLIFYSFDVYRYLSKMNRKFMVTVTASIVAVVILVYPLVNHYRNSLLGGADFSEAVESAQKQSEKNSKSFSLSFIDRINGVSEFYVTTKLGKGRKFGFDAMFNDSVMDLTKEKLYGTDKDKALTAFGATYFSVFYLIGGGMLLVVFGFIAGWVIRWSLSLLKNSVFKSSFTFQAYLPIVCILWVRVLASGGNIALPMKELILVVISLYLLERYATTNKI